jgi:drug/metabolite transporter (DMT)-like permease
MSTTPAVWLALLAAALFGASTPFVKLLIGDGSALALAGLLYLGSGLGLAVARLLRDRGWQASGLSGADWRWFGGAIGFGGVLGPLLLVVGLGRTGAGTASLLLNLEAVLTAVLAWVVFREHAGRRIVAGMGFIVAGGIALSWQSGEAGRGDWIGPAAIMGACLCWAIDNNLTRKVSASDALFIASAKGLVAGAVNLGLALVLGQALPAWPLAEQDPARAQHRDDLDHAYPSPSPRVCSGTGPSLALRGQGDQRGDPVETGRWPAKTLRPQHVVAEEQRQVEDHADHGGGDGGERGGEFEIVVGRLDQRPAGQDEDEGRQEGEPGHQHAATAPARNRLSGPNNRLHVAADKADEGHHHDQRPRRGFTQRQPVDHLGRREPAVVPDRALIHIGQHRVGAAEGQQCGLGEEPAHLRQRVAPAVAPPSAGPSASPTTAPPPPHLQQPGPAEAGMFRRRACHRRSAPGRRIWPALPWPPPALNLSGRPAPAHVADERGDRDDGRERHIQRKDRHEGRSRNRPQGSCS